MRFIFSLPARLLALPSALAFCLMAQAASADSTAMHLQNGQPVLIGQDQQLMLSAAQKVMLRDYPAALGIYNQVIGMNGNNIQAYIQRSVVKREMKDDSGSQADAAIAVHLSDAAIAASPNDPMLYYQRGTAYRMTKDYPRAREDIRHAMQMSGGQHDDWETDLRAIDLEEKINQ